MYQPVEGDRVIVSKVGTLVRSGSGKARYWDVVGEDGRSFSLEDEEFTDGYWTFDRLPPKLPTTPGSVVRHDLEFAKGILAVLDDQGMWVDAYSRRRMLSVSQVVYDAGLGR